MPWSTVTTPAESSDASRAPQFYVGRIPIYGRVSLSPMAGFSDSPYRLLCRRAGAAFSWTEFVSADGLRRKDARTIELFRFEEAERPIAFQIFGANPASLLRAALIAETLGPDWIDINMGCSVKTVAGRGAGAGMLRDPRRTGRIFGMLQKRLGVPLTAKIRLGWDRRTRNYTDMARILEDNGAALITVHGRTREQAYSGEADWDAIGAVAAAVSIPTLGNGDLQSVAEAERKIADCGLAGAVIGRAAIGDPWLFGGVSGRDRSSLEIVNTVRAHLESMLAFYPGRGLKLFRKHLARYLSLQPALARLKPHLLTVESVAEMREICLDLVQNPGSLEYAGGVRPA